MSTQDINNTLAERGERYGKFEHHAQIVQDLKAVVICRKGYDRLPPYMKQALDVIFDKVARMLNGDPYYLDNWHDIQGYAKLVEDILTEKERFQSCPTANPVKLAEDISFSPKGFA